MNKSMNNKAVCRTAGLHRSVKYAYGRHKISWFVQLAYGGARPLAGLEHVCSRLFNETISQRANRVAT